MYRDVWGLYVHIAWGRALSFRVGGFGALIQHLRLEDGQEVSPQAVALSETSNEVALVETIAQIIKKVPRWPLSYLPLGFR